jgi:hypothetical protein
MAFALNYNFSKYPELKWGYNDLNGDGINDTLFTEWNGKKMVFISDNGRLPWGEDVEKRDWDAYLNMAFNVDSNPPLLWNEERATWGSYTIMVDKDGCGRFDSYKDFYYKVLDINGDGAPEAEYYHLTDYPGFMQPVLYSNKLHVILNGERDISHINFKDFFYAEEQEYGAGGKYFMNVHGSGFFLNSYSPDPKNSWENPIAWYDFDFDGRTNMVMRVGDTNSKDNIYRGDANEFEVAFELNSNTNEEKYHSLDMQLTYYNYKANGVSYQPFVDCIKGLKFLPGTEFLSENRAKMRSEIIRKYIPYLDGYKIGTDFEKWDGVWLIFDEDDDDNRWEEMFARHETEVNASGNWYIYSDRIGDRIEWDMDFKGEGKLYIGKFDGRIHLYHSEQAFWDIDYFSTYKGSADRVDTDEGIEPPAGLKYPRVRYSDTDDDGFIDTIEYMTVEYMHEKETERIYKTVKLADFCEADELKCQLIDPRVDSEITNWSLEKWNGMPFTEEDFKNTACKKAYEKFYALYGKVGNSLWSDAQKLYSCAKAHGLNMSEQLDKNVKINYTKEEQAQLKDILVPEGYSRHLNGESRRDRYNNGYWLKEKVFADILKFSQLNTSTLEKYYYTNNIDRLCEYITNGTANG